LPLSPDFETPRVHCFLFKLVQLFIHITVAQQSALPVFSLLFWIVSTYIPMK